MKLTNSLKKRFCKDMNIPIQVYDEPYFSERIHLLNPYYSTIKKLKAFQDVLADFKDENEYYQYYNNVKDNAISYLEANLDNFKNVDFDKYKIKNNFPSKDIYNEMNIGKKFISIDMKEANFSCLKHFDPNIFPEINNYTDFIKLFADKDYIIQSKYIRQVIFGNQNPKRQVRYQKYLMDNLLTKLLTKVNTDNIVCFSNDEIVILDKNDEEMNENVVNLVDHYSQEEKLRLKIENFTLEKIYNGYKKVNQDGQVNFKDLNSIDIIYAIREHQGEEIKENDKVFVYEGKLAKLL